GSRETGCGSLAFPHSIRWALQVDIAANPLFMPRTRRGSVPEVIDRGHHREGVRRAADRTAPAQLSIAKS
ncbi:hypothetical protein, partial [Burkholderia gladioli]|uniref:hypothetical protein n=1 Tax=Burkholderia gladioli TaxID=28095 RepID=UPI001C615604